MVILILPHAMDGGLRNPNQQVVLRPAPGCQPALRAAAPAGDDHLTDRPTAAVSMYATAMDWPAMGYLE